jgi:hypothetical protein
VFSSIHAKSKTDSLDCRQTHFPILKGTRTLGITYGGSDEELNNEELNIYCDADWASDMDRKSISGYVIMLAGGAVAWSSKKQSTVAVTINRRGRICGRNTLPNKSSGRSLLKEVRIPLPSTSTIFSDNQAAVSIAHHQNITCERNILILHTIFYELFTFRLKL